MAVFLISCLIWIVPVTSFEWTHHMILDQDGMFHILWKPEKDKITFELQVSSISSDNENQIKYFDSTGTPPLTLFFETLKNRVSRKPWC